MKPTTDELIKQYEEHDCKTNKEGHCIEGTILFSKLQGRLDVLEEHIEKFKVRLSHSQYLILLEEIAKIKEVLK